MVEPNQADNHRGSGARRDAAARGRDRTADQSRVAALGDDGDTGLAARVHDRHDLSG
jgi:hypothetical protein